MRTITMLLLCLLFAAAPAIGQEIRFDVMSTAEPPVFLPEAEPAFRFDVLHVAQPPAIAADQIAVNAGKVQFTFDLLAMPVHGSQPPTSPGHSAAILKADTERRPVVLVYVAPPDQVCTVCERLKKELAAERALPLTFEVKTEAPSWVTAYPTLHWQAADGKWKYVTGWKGLRDFESTYDRTQTAKPATTIRTSASGYPLRGNVWSHPGSGREAIIQHLLTGVEHRGKFTRSQLDRLSTAELESLHSDDHDSRVQWSRLPQTGTGYNLRPVGAVAALGYRQGSTRASVAAIAERAFVANLQAPPAMGHLSVKDQKKSCPSGVSQSGNA